jgi:hypothetical protein
MASKKTATNPYVLVTTAHRGVFWGQLQSESPDGKTVILNGARCAIRWSTTHGFLELAQVGPNANSKLGMPAPTLKLYDVTSIAICTDAANLAWSKA